MKSEKFHTVGTGVERPNREAGGAGAVPPL